jgi:ABC-type polysaccharide/polyol phosphate export permease
MALYATPVIIMGGITQTFANDYMYGTLSLSLATNVNRLRLYAARSLVHLPNGVLSLVTALAFAWAVMDLDTSRAQWTAIAPIAAVLIASSAAFALFLGDLVLVQRDWLVPYTAGLGLTLSLTGVIVPLSELPPVLHQVGEALPLTHSLHAFRAAFDGAALGDIAPDLWREAVVGIGYGVAGYLWFKVLEAQARRTGNFERAAA